jgi:acyl dehydratase
VTTTDNSWFTQLTMNTNPIHVDHHFARRTRFGRPVVNSTFTLALVTGLSVADVSQNAVANLGWDEVRLPHPVFEGDTIYARSEVIAVRPSRSNSDVGILTVRTSGYNQDGVVVITFRRDIMVYRRSALPEPPAPDIRDPGTT